MNRHCLLPIFLVLAIGKLSTSLKCYVCSSPGQRCWDPFDPSAHSPDECDIEDAVCIKNKIPPASKQAGSTHRVCAVPDYCKLFEVETKNCFTCKTDLCNSSFLPVPSLSTLIPLILIVLKCILSN